MSTARGRAAEMRLLAWMMEWGNYEIFTPTAEDNAVDAVWRRTEPDGMHGPWRAGQIKRVYRKNGHPTVNLVRSNGSRYESTDADYLVAVEIYGGNVSRVWMIPFHQVCQFSRLRLAEAWDRFVVYDMTAESVWS